MRAGLLLPQGDPAQPGVHQVRRLRGAGEEEGRQHRVQGLLRPRHQEGTGVLLLKDSHTTQTSYIVT